jgi:hypothetical protein
MEKEGGTECRIRKILTLLSTVLIDQKGFAEETIYVVYLKDTC